MTLPTSVLVSRPQAVRTEVADELGTKASAKARMGIALIA
jgi:hypothetical protein